MDFLYKFNVFEVFIFRLVLLKKFLASFVVHMPGEVNTDYLTIMTPSLLLSSCSILATPSMLFCLGICGRYCC